MQAPARLALLSFVISTDGQPVHLCHTVCSCQCMHHILSSFMDCLACRLRAYGSRSQQMVGLLLMHPPALRYSMALSRFTPPPMCRPPGHALSASRAVALRHCICA